MTTRRNTPLGGKPPAKDLEITFTITEDPNGKLSIRTSIPDHAAGTVALLLADLAVDCMREAMRQVGHDSQIEESRLQ